MSPLESSRRGGRYDTLVRLPVQPGVERLKHRLHVYRHAYRHVVDACLCTYGLYGYGPLQLWPARVQTCRGNAPRTVGEPPIAGAVILSTGMPMPARWARRRRCRDACGAGCHNVLWPRRRCRGRASPACAVGGWTPATQVCRKRVEARAHTYRWMRAAMTY